MIPQPQGTSLPPPSLFDVATREDREPSVFMQAFDDWGAAWAGIGPVPAHVETNRTSGSLEIWLVASFTWMHDGPSPEVATVKVTGWSADNDYLLTPADSSATRCHGKGTSVVIKIPVRTLA